MKRWAPSLLLLTTAACGNAEPLSRGQAAIFGGSPAPDDAAVVAVVNFAGGQCSGSLIAPRLVMTARHCVADTAGKELEVLCGQTKFQPPDSAGAIFVEPLPELSEDPNDYRAVSELRMPEGLGDDLCGSDVVLLRLKEPLSGIPPLPVRSDSPVRAGESYSAIGFGIDEALPDKPSGVRKRGEGYEVTCGGADCDASDVRDNEWVGTGGPCSGDSGGPALDADGKVIGVVSRGKSACSEPVFSDVASRAAWLDAELAAVAEPEADGPEESCALSGAPRGAGARWLGVIGLLLLRRRRRTRAPHV